MKKFLPTLGLLLLLVPILGNADTPPPGTVKAKTFTGDGATAITSTGAAGALDVNVTNSGGLSTVNQGNAGAESWLVSVTGSALPTNACQETGGHLASIDSKLSSPMPVTGTFWQSTQPVSLATLPAPASLPLPTGAATASNQSTMISDLATIASNTADAGTPVVSGTVSISNFPVTQPVSGTFWQSTQPVSGTFWQSTQPVSGTFWQSTQPVSLATLPAPASLPLPTGAATSALQTAGNTALSTINTTLGSPMQNSGGSVTANAGSGTFAVSGTFWQTTQPVSGTFWQSIQPVSGTVTANAGSGTFTVDASGHTVPVSGTFFQSTQPVSAASLPLPTGAAVASKQPALGIAGTPSSDVLTVQGATSMTPLKVDGSAVTQPVSGTFWQSTQPVSLATLPAPASLPLPTGAATSALQTTGNTTLSSILTALGSPFQAGASIANTSFIATQATGSNLHVVVDTAPTTAVTGTFWQTTQPVSLVTLPAPASLPLPTGAATSALQTTGNSSLTTINSTLGSPFQAGGSIGNTSFAATQATAANLNATVVGTVSTQAVGGATDSQTTGTVSTVITLTAPSNAQGFILQNLGTSTANLRFAMGATATTTLGMQLAPGQDSGFIPTSANVSVVSESGTQNYNVQWVAK